NSLRRQALLMDSRIGDYVSNKIEMYLNRDSSHLSSLHKFLDGDRGINRAKFYLSVFKQNTTHVGLFQSEESFMDDLTDVSEEEIIITTSTIDENLTNQQTSSTSIFHKY